MARSSPSSSRRTAMSPKPAASICAATVDAWSPPARGGATRPGAATGRCGRRRPTAAAGPRRHRRGPGGARRPRRRGAGKPTPRSARREPPRSARRPRPKRASAAARRDRRPWRRRRWPGRTRPPPGRCRWPPRSPTDPRPAARRRWRPHPCTGRPPSRPAGGGPPPGGRAPRSAIGARRRRDGPCTRSPQNTTDRPPTPGARRWSDGRRTHPAPPGHPPPPPRESAASASGATQPAAGETGHDVAPRRWATGHRPDATEGGSVGRCGAEESGRRPARSCRRADPSFPSPRHRSRPARRRPDGRERRRGGNFY